jgi:hypothetical protein
MTITLPAADEWTQDGVFMDADGVPVSAYQDVVLLREIPIELSEDGPYRIPAGTQATVLMFVPGHGGVAQLECHWPEGTWQIGYEKTSQLRFKK